MKLGDVVMAKGVHWQEAKMWFRYYLYIIATAVLSGYHCLLLDSARIAKPRTPLDEV